MFYICTWLTATSCYDAPISVLCTCLQQIFFCVDLDYVKATIFLERISQNIHILTNVSEKYNDVLMFVVFPRQKAALIMMKIDT